MHNINPQGQELQTPDVEYTYMIENILYFHKTNQLVQKLSMASTQSLLVQTTVKCPKTSFIAVALCMTLQL